MTATLRQQLGVPLARNYDLGRPAAQPQFLLFGAAAGWHCVVADDFGGGFPRHGTVGESRLIVPKECVACDDESISVSLFNLYSVFGAHYGLGLLPPKYIPNVVPLN